MWILVPNIDLRCFVMRQLLSQIYALFRRTIWSLKNCAGVQKLTNYRYGGSWGEPKDYPKDFLIPSKNHDIIYEQLLNGWQFLTRSGVDRRELKIWAGRRSIARQILPAPNNISTAHNWFPDLSDRQLWRVGFLDAILIKATMHCIALQWANLLGIGTQNCNLDFRYKFDGFTCQLVHLSMF